MKNKKETTLPATDTCSDATTTVADLKQKVEQAFITEREWTPFHSPKNLSMNIAIEAAELMEHFLWIDAQQSYDLLNDPEKRKEIEHELADIFSGILSFANRCNIDLTKAFEEKFAIFKKKYPAEKARGKAEKYTHYQEQKKYHKNKR